MKALVLAMAVGGLTGLVLGERERPPPDPWYGEALTALVGDARVADVDRALFSVERRLAADPYEAVAIILKNRLVHQKRCRQTYEQAEHELASLQHRQARRTFRKVANDCQLYDAAQVQAQVAESHLTPRDVALGSEGSPLEPWAP